MRILVTGALAAGLLVVAAAPSSAAWVARHRMDAAGYQAAFDQYTGEGYRPVHIASCRVPGERYYAAIWSDEGGGAWAARHGLGAEQYQTVFNEMTNNGFRPLDLTVADGNFAAIWVRDNVGFVARHGLDGAGYQQAFDQYVGEGYRLVDVEGYRSGGSTLYAAIWTREGGSAWIARHGMTSGGYQQAFDEITGQGYRPVHVAGYYTNDGVRFAAIWDRGGGAWVARHNLTSDQYQAAFDQFVGQGYRLADVSCYSDGSQDLYAAIWTR